LTQVTTTYPTSKGIVTIPKIELHASVLKTDGTTSTYLMPRATELVRGAAELISLTPNVSNNLFELSDGYSTGLVSTTLTRINKRYFMITNVIVTGTGGATDTTTTATINVRPDARGQLNKSFTATDANGDIAACTIIGHIDWDTGAVQYSVTCTTTSAGVTFTTDHSIGKTVFSPRSGDVGRVKVQLKIKGWDVDVDSRDDFEIELETEVLQDYKDIYNVDLIKTISEAIKTQILLNKDHDIAYFLTAAEAEMSDWGASQALDMSDFYDGGSVTVPATVSDVFKSVVPRIAIVNRVIQQNFGASPQYLLTGLNTSAILESLQQYATNFFDSNKGDFGFIGNAAAFSKQTILYSPAISDSKIYPIYKAPADNLSRSVLIDLVYKPLYIVEEITNSLKRTFVKSRTAIEISDTRAVGVITVSGTDEILGA